MAVGLTPPTHLLPIQGVRLSAVAAGIHYRGHADLALIDISPGARMAAAFTRNACCAAPVVVAKRHLASRTPRFLLVNAGNANAGMGEIGMQDALSCCRAVAELTGCDSGEVLPFSTGVIGQRLPTDRIIGALPQALGHLDADGWRAAAAAIMTTDTIPKGVSRTVVIDGKPIHITGIVKGAGMIRPDMATMLAFLATDVSASQGLLNDVLRETIAVSFNRITVDGDTSTNDACVLIATGRSGVFVEPGNAEASAQLQAAISDVMVKLAQAIVRDAEGATKFITITVRGAASVDEARRTAFTIAHSPLVKTACFASDPNWGRILAAVGRAGLAQLAIDQVEIFLDEVCVARQGAVALDYTEAAGRQVMTKPEITIGIDLHRGSNAFHVWTSDLSYDYIRINAEYRS